MLQPLVRPIFGYYAPTLKKLSIISLIASLAIQGLSILVSRRVSCSWLVVICLSVIAYWSIAIPPPQNNPIIESSIHIQKETSHLLQENPDDISELRKEVTKRLLEALESKDDQKLTALQKVKEELEGNEPDLEKIRAELNKIKYDHVQ